MPKKALNHYQLLKYAGLFTWICVTSPLVFEPFFFNYQLPPPYYVAWWIADLAFGAAYWRLMQDFGRPSRPVLAHLLLATMTVSALAVSFISQSGLGGVFILVIAGVLPWFFGLRACIFWLLVQHMAQIPLFALYPDVSLTKVLLVSGLLLGYSTFMFVTSFVAMRQARRREELSVLNSKLESTQALLGESSRIAERVRIARELHDLVGHHLTALSLNLEVASHLVEGKALEHVSQAQSLARLLLTDVRDVVSHMREDDAVDLGSALRTLVTGIPSPKVHLEMPDNFVVDDPQQAHLLLRCAQEMITNSVKHANASNLWLKFNQDDQGLSFDARDDGDGVSLIEKGNGLQGMDERLREFGGELRVESQPGAGFHIGAWLPGMPLVGNSA